MIIHRLYALYARAYANASLLAHEEEEAEVRSPAGSAPSLEQVVTALGIHDGASGLSRRPLGAFARVVTEGSLLLVRLGWRRAIAPGR